MDKCLPSKFYLWIIADRTLTIVISMASYVSSGLDGIS